MNLRKRTREDIFGKKRVLQPQIKPKINTIIMESNNICEYIRCNKFRIVEIGGLVGY